MDIVKMIAEDPLYSEYEANISTITQLLEFRSGVDRYCPDCKKETIYTAVKPDFFYIDSAPWQEHEEHYAELSIIPIKLICSRSPDHISCVTFVQTNNKLIKSGIYPSQANDLIDAIKKYQKQFPDDYKELRRAYGLYDYDVGIGAFTYLRRVFERRIDKAAERKKEKNPKWKPKKLLGMWMEDKIQELRDELPEFLVENKKVYGILSKGIHELTEEKCLKHFSVLSMSINLMLDQELSIIDKHNRQKELKKALDDISSEIS